MERCAVWVWRSLCRVRLSPMWILSVSIKVNDDGFYSLMIGASIWNKGCDTILAQMVADCMECDLDNIAVYEWIRMYRQTISVLEYSVPHI